MCITCDTMRSDREFYARGVERLQARLRESEAKVEQLEREVAALTEDLAFIKRAARITE